jgi:hypothetical protein
MVEKTDLGFCDGANQRWEVYKNTKFLVVPEWDYLLKMLDFFGRIVISPNFRPAYNLS